MSETNLANQGECDTRQLRRAQQAVFKYGDASTGEISAVARQQSSYRVSGSARKQVV